MTEMKLIDGFGVFEVQKIIRMSNHFWKAKVTVVHFPSFITTFDWFTNALFDWFTSALLLSRLVVIDVYYLYKESPTPKGPDHSPRQYPILMQI